MTLRPSTPRPNGAREQTKRRGYAIATIGLLALAGVSAAGAQIQVIDISGTFNWRLYAPNHTLVGFQGNPLEPDASQPCTFKVDLWGTTDKDDVPVHLWFTALLPHGRMPHVSSAVYEVGAATLHAEPWKDESASLGEVFFYLALPHEVGGRTVDGVELASEFYRSSGSGRVALGPDPEDPNYLHVILFDVEMVENVGDRYEPRKLQLEGNLVFRLQKSLAGMLSAVAGTLKSKYGDVQTSGYLCFDPPVSIGPGPEAATEGAEPD